MLMLRLPLPQRWKMIGLLLLLTIGGFGVSMGMLAVIHEVLSTGGIIIFDQVVQNGIHRFTSPFMTLFMSTCTTLGEFLGITGLAAFLSLALLLKKRWDEAIGVLVAIGGARVLNQIVKYWFQRQRPTVGWALLHEDGFSFPSSHAMMSLVLYGMLAYLLCRLIHRVSLKVVVIVLMAALVVCIGVSRVYLGVHYPSDVLAGFAASSSWLASVLLALEARRLLPRFMRGRQSD